MNNLLLYVIAGSYEEAVRFATDRGVNRSFLKHITCMEDLSRVDGNGQTLLVCGTAYDQPYIHGVLRTARACGFTIKYDKWAI